MKKLIIILFVLLAGCTPPPTPFPPVAVMPETVLKAEYMKLQDSIQTINARHQESIAINQAMQDSIIDLKDRPLMTEAQFLELYKYESLRKYYQICKKNPTQKKFYWGWTARIFEQ